MANDKNDLTVNIKATFDKSNIGDFKSEVTKAVEDAAKSVKAIEIKANTQSARNSMQKFTSYLAELSNAKDGFTTIKIHANTKDAEKSIEDLQSKLKDLKVSFDTSKLGNQLNVALRDLNKNDSLKKVKLGIDTSNLLRDINKAITSINNEDSLKKLKLGVDVNYLQQQLNKAVKGLDTTVKLKTKLETTSRTSETKGTVTTNKTSKEEAQQYQSLFSKRAASIANLDRAYQEFGRNSKEVSTALREFAAASKDVRKFGRDTGVLSLNKVKSDIERQLGAGLTTDFTKNWLRMEYDKVLKDINNLDRQLKPEKYEKIQAKAEYQRLDAEHKDLAAQLKAVADAYKEEAAEVRRRTKEMKFRDDVNKGVSKGILQQLADSAKGDRRLDSDKMQRFLGELQNYRNLVGNNKSTFFTDISRDIGITSTHPYFNAMRTLYQSARSEEAKWKQNPITANVDVKGTEKVEELNQKVLTTSQQFMRLRGEALKAGNALNKATDPKDLPRLRAEFQKAIQALVNYQRATRGLTKGGEAQLVEKLAVGNIKEQTEAYKVLVEWIKKAVQAQRDLDVTTGRKLPRKSNDTDLMSWFNNMDIGRAVSGMAYAARGELNAVQAFGNLLSNLSKVSGVVGIMVKGLGALALAGLAVYGVVNTVISAFSSLTGMLGRVANVIYDILRPGIELYKTRQTAELAIAAAISSRATENGREIPFDRSINISKEMMERVIADAAMSAFNPQELIDALRGTLPLALGKGWNLEQAYDITKGVASVAKVINLAPNQVLQELRDILQGTISSRSSQVAGATGITSEELKEAEAQGRLYEYIQEHLAKFTVALERYSTTLAGALDRLSETWALGMESVFQKIAPVANSLINEFIDNFIGVYKDSKGNILRNPADFYTIDEVTGEKTYKEGHFEWSEYIQSFGDSLVDLIKFIAPIIDEILAFVQELTGKDDAIKAVVEMIKIAIRVTVSLGEFILSFAMGTIEAMNLMETPISVLISVLGKLGKTFIHLVGIGHFMSAAFVEIASTLLQAIHMLRVGDIKGLKELPSTISNKIDKFSANYEALTKLGENINTPVATSFAELFGIDRESLKGKSGIVTELVERALNRVNNGSNQPSVDWKQIFGTAKEDNKQNLANLRKAMQAAIEDIKQALKDALAQLKDIAEQNELAYRQGYKSVEDYFTQKAQIEYQEAQLKLDALQKEYALVSALDTGTDESAKYQKDRDLIKLNGEIVIQQREFTKKQEQLLEVAQHIENHMANQTYKYGIQAKSVGGINSSANYNISNADLESWGVNNDMPMSAIKGILKASKELGVDPRLVMAMAMQESGGYQSAVSSVGARGVMQLMPDTAEGLGVDPYDEWENIYGGVKYILQQLEYFGGDMVKAIAAYNAGPGAVDEYGGIPPYEETQNYVSNILAMYEEMGGLSTEIVENTVKLEESVEEASTELHGRMPRAVSTLAEAFEKAAEEGQNQMIEAQKKYASYLNEPYLYETISSAEISAKYNKQIEIAKARYGEMIPAIANYLELAFPIEKLKVEAKSLEQFVDSRLKWIEDDSLAMNKQLREKTVLFPQAIDTYISYFSEKINDWAVTDLLEKMAQKADELAKLGAVSEARDITKKIIEVRSKFISMIQSWLDEMNNYFNYRKELVNADSGLTSFVKEERIKQLEKGEARVKAVAYREEAVKLEKLQLDYQTQLNKVIEGRNDELDSMIPKDAELLKMNIAMLETDKQRATRQAEINEKLGEQKTLWQETMDAANQALENGLYNFMTDYINTAESLGEALRNLALDILKDLQKFFAKKTITSLMHMITGTPNEEYKAPEVAELQQSNVYLDNINNTLIRIESTLETNTTTQNTSTLPTAPTMYGNNLQKQYPVQQQQQYQSIPSPYDTFGKTSNVYSSNPTMPSNPMGTGMFDKLFSNIANIFSSSLFQLFGTGMAIDGLINGDKKEQLLSLIYIELQTIWTTLISNSSYITTIMSYIITMSSYLQMIFDSVFAIRENQRTQMMYSGQLAFASGGLVRGAGTSTSDSIPAMLSNGEYVVNARSASKYHNLLEAINGGSYRGRNSNGILHLSDGGEVSKLNYDNITDNEASFTGIVAWLRAIFDSLTSILMAIQQIITIIGSKISEEQVDTTEGIEEAESVPYESYSKTHKYNKRFGNWMQSFNDFLGISSSDNPRLVDSLGEDVPLQDKMVVDLLQTIADNTYTIISLLDLHLIWNMVSKLFGFATGGLVRGVGTSTSDSIPAMLSNGEYVISADAVRRYGTNFLDAVNSGKFTRMKTTIPRFADGGYVGDALQDTARGMVDFARNIGTNVAMNNDISIALVRDEQEAIREWAKSPSGGQKFLVDFAKGNGRVFSRFSR